MLWRTIPTVLGAQLTETSHQYELLGSLGFACSPVCRQNLASKSRRSVLASKSGFAPWVNLPNVRYLRTIQQKVGQGSLPGMSMDFPPAFGLEHVHSKALPKGMYHAAKNVEPPVALNTSTGVVSPPRGLST